MSLSGLNAPELRAVTGLASLYGLRMLGLFMVLPVLPLLAADLDGATPVALGLVIGIYGLTQAILQLPFGWLSDRVGRKPLIFIGLGLFALGSLVAALADSLTGLVIGRALQGSGAIASVLMALLADLTRDEKRTQAMASVGLSIGLAFILAMALGPWLAGWLGLSGLFWLIFLLTLLGMGVLWRWVPTPTRVRSHLDAGIQPQEIRGVLLHPQLLRLDLSILLLHLLLTAIFLAIPALLIQAGWALPQHGWIYLGTMLLGFFAMIPLIILGEKRQKMKTMLLLGFVLLAVALAFLSQWHSAGPLLLGLWLFFVGFNLLEASLPSLISKQAPVRSKGTAMGVYSTAQFLGAFLGGVLGGLVLANWGASGLLLAAAVLCVIWLLGLVGYQPPAYLSSRVFALKSCRPEAMQALQAQLYELSGVEEVVLLAEEATGYLKLDRRQLDEAQLDTLLAQQ